MLINKTKSVGIFYVVATPIGNLQDMTLRGLDILKRVDWIAAENTKHAMNLLKHFSVSTPTFSLYDFNENARIEQIINYLKLGKSVALISNAGTPLISDPGFHVVEAVREQGFTIVPIPGACAAITALCAAGLPTDSFSFIGFLPAKATSREKLLRTLVDVTSTLVFYEAPHRLFTTLEVMLRVFGNRKITIARELTKIHETIITNTLESIIDYFLTHPEKQRGEIVILVSGTEKKSTRKQNCTNILAILLAELPSKQAISLASKITGAKKNVLYKLMLEKYK